MVRIVALAVWLLAGVAHAGVGVVATGEPSAQAPVEGLIKAWLSEHAFVIEDALEGDAKSTMLNCLVIEDMKCARGVFEARSSSANLVQIRVDLEPGEGPNYTLTTYWFVKGHDPSVDKRQCMRCDAEALAKAVDGLMGALVGAATAAKGRVKITARSQGVIVWIDGVKYGLAPFERDLDAGRHELKLTARGRTLSTQNISIESGRTIEVASPDLVESKPFPWRPTSLIAGGAAAAVVGGVFLYYGTRGGPDDRYVYDNATQIGLPITLVGSAAIISGGVLFAREQRTFSWLPTSLIGSGVATAAVGGLFLHYGSLGGPDERYVYDHATTIGLPITLVGGAAIIAGGVLLVRAPHQTAPVLTASSNRLQFNLVGAF